MDDRLLKGDIFNPDARGLPLIVHVKAHLNNLRGVDALTAGNADIPVFGCVYCYYNQGGVIMMFRLSDCGVNESEMKGLPLGNLVQIPQPSFFKRLLIAGYNLVKILVGKKVRTHHTLGLSQKLMAKTLWKE